MVLHPSEDYDFTPHLEAAIVSALSPSKQALPGQASTSETELFDYATKPDHFVIRGLYVECPTDVVISGSEHYLSLLQQALVAVRPHSHVGMKLSPDEEDMTANYIATHEKIHGAVVRRRGNSQTEDLYGVRFLPAARDSLSVMGLQTIVGPLRKVHIAEVGAAPAGRKNHDMAMVAGLGYDPADLETMQRVADLMPNVPEGWHPGLIENEEELLAISAIAHAKKMTSR